MRVLYDLIVALVALVLLPYGFIKGLPYKLAVRGTFERFAHYPRGVKQKLKANKVILVHAVSVGEVNAAAPLIRKLKAEYPSHFLVLSTTTFTGRQVAEQIAELDLLVFFPLDLSFIMRRFLRRLTPDLVLIVETELWPNFLRLIRRRRIPLLLVNGRISKTSFSRYRKVRFLLRPLLQAFSCFCMQDSICARRIRALGAPTRKVQVTGNLKFDLNVEAIRAENNVQLQGLIRRSEFVWVGGSTRSGEEEILLRCHQQLLEKGIPSFLVLVPRHPARFDEVAGLLEQSGLGYLRRSGWDGSPPGDETSVVLLDSMGELDRIYPMADVVFVGGSLVPIGGHNLLEPAAWGKPVLHGPHMDNFPEITRLLRSVGASRRIGNQKDLLKNLEELFSDPVKGELMGSNGRRMIESNAGATLKTLDAIRAELGKRDAAD